MLIDVPARRHDFRSWLEEAVKDAVREEGKLRGYGSDPEAKYPRMGPDGERNGVLSFTTMRRIHRANDLVRAVVDAKARQIVSLNWDVQRADEERFAPMGLAREIACLFRTPNVDREDWTLMMRQVLQDVLVLDAGVIEKVRDSSGKLVELVPRDAATFRPQVDEHRRLKGYEQVLRDWKGDEKKVQFAADDVVYFKFNPCSHSVWGLSPLETLAITIGGDMLAMTRNVEWLQDGNLMDNVLVLGRVGALALEQFKQFFQNHKGEMGRLPILSDLEDGGSGAKVLPLRQSNRDMQFLELDRWMFQRICGVYQIAASDVILMESHATKAASETEADVSESKGLRPELAIIEGRFSADVCQEFHPNLCFRFVEADKTDALDESNVWGQMFRNGGVLNELRVRAGLKPLQGPKVDIDGVMVNSYDLPINTFTGLPFGVAAPNPFEDFGSDPSSEGGDASDDPFKSLVRRARLLKGRRRSSPDPDQRAFAAYEAHRALLEGRAEGRLPHDGRAGAGSLRAALAATQPEGSLRQ